MVREYVVKGYVYDNGHRVKVYRTFARQMEARAFAVRELYRIYRDRHEVGRNVGSWAIGVYRDDGYGDRLIQVGQATLILNYAGVFTLWNCNDKDCTLNWLFKGGHIEKFGD